MNTEDQGEAGALGVGRGEAGARAASDAARVGGDLVYNRQFFFFVLEPEMNPGCDKAASGVRLFFFFFDSAA